MTRQININKKLIHADLFSVPSRRGEAAENAVMYKSRKKVRIYELKAK